ncbi:hypothetical protein [Marinoscillum sp.]|uniref:hypothetical protein n=1 Tax=Marinoscillum sp. TaxID=2024838 RepID=UPI003BAD213D
MKKQFVKLLEKQIDKLEAEDFDLEAWKSSSISILTRIFGEDSPKVKQIDQLKIDYSSWALRDSNSQYKPVESCKRKGREILSTAIDEIDTFGVPTNGPSDLLKEYFDDEEVKILLSESGDKTSVISKLKKKDLEKLVLKLLNR